jgi:hypothetical protein
MVVVGFKRERKSGRRWRGGLSKRGSRTPSLRTRGGAKRPPIVQ